MASELYAWLVEATLASSVAIILVLLLRRPLRATFGAGAAYAASLATIRATAKEAGRDPGAIEAGICINVLLADSEAEARAVTNHPLLRAFGLWTSNAAFTGLGRTHPLGEHFYPMRDYLPSAYTREEAERLVEQVPPEIVERVAIIGTPDQVAEEIRPYFDAGVEHLLLWDLAPFAGVKAGKVFDLAAALK